MAQIFISHSQADKEVKNFFETIFAVTKVRAVFVEYENYAPPPGPYIQAEINQSNAVFLLLGPSVEKLLQTKVWVASETGLAQQAQKAIWVFEPYHQPCNIPVPFTFHYVPYVQSDQAFQYIRTIVNSYDDSAATAALVRGAAVGAAGGAMLSDDGKKGEGAAIGALIGAMFESLRTDPSRTRPMGTPLTCAYPNCRASYRVHGTPPSFPCPVCRQPLVSNWDQMQGPQFET